MKILIVIPFAYPPHRGGLEYEAYYLGKGLANRGHRVDVLTSNRCVLNKTEEVQQGFFYQRIASIILARRLEIPLISLHRIKRTMEEADIVYVKGILSVFTLTFSLIALLMKKKMVIHVHNEDVGSRGDLFGKLVLFLENVSKFIIERATLIQGETHLDIEYVLRRLNKRLITSIIPFGLPDQFFDDENYSLEGRRLVHINEGRIILFLGRIDQLKGPHIALRAFAELSRENGFKDVFLVIAGSRTNYLSQVLKDIGEFGLEESIRVLTDVTDKQKIWLYDASTVVLIPSIADRVEAFCLVLSEAWAREKPVIAAKVGALAVRIENDMNGILVAPRSSHSLADALRRLLNDKEKLNRMSKSGRHNVWRISEVVDVFENEFMRISYSRWSSLSESEERVPIVEDMHAV